MKPLSSALAAALFLFSAHGVAEQTPPPVVTSCANVLVVPPSQDHSPFALHPIGTGSDNSDALVVPYYNQHAM
ncbi:multiple antibiotic resistance protein MarB [Staphylococcus pseudintermedius]|nr:multiple antibiotic resistance protein MarB [Staphylococcus pseudintermedius]